MRFRRTVAIDFDGVIHKHVSKWTEAWEIHDGPVDGAFEFLERVLGEFNVVIFSARAADPAGAEAIRRWLVKHWRTEPPRLSSSPEEFFPGVIEITSQKPHAFIYIDDRGWHFDGAFPTMEELRSFESWTKKPAPPEMKYTGAKTVAVEAPDGFDLIINGVVVGATRALVGSGDKISLRKMTLKYVVDGDGYKDYGNLSAVDPPYQIAMSCEKCKTRWLGCWDNFQCPECGEGELPSMGQSG